MIRFLSQAVNLGVRHQRHQVLSGFGMIWLFKKQKITDPAAPQETNIAPLKGTFENP